jgi:leucyl aminopeptidase
MVIYTNEKKLNTVIPVKKSDNVSLPKFVLDKIQDQELFGYKKLTPFHLEEGTIYILGLGDKPLSRSQYQELFSSLTSIKEEVSVDLELFSNEILSQVELAKLFSETYYLKTFSFDTMKTKESDNKLGSFYLMSNANIEKAIEDGKIQAEAVNHARQLVFLPPNVLTAEKLADYAVDLAKKYNVDYDVYDLKQIKKMKMGGLLAVNQGSDREPRFIVLNYKNNPESDELYALVGKGLTYDTGGYSLKPKDGMAGMKSDMGGSATVLGAFEIIVRKQIKANVMLIIPATDNMIGAKAIVPDDVYTSYSGKTVEVNNTDAEGRLVLADGLAYAVEKGATKIFDAATLTGGVLVALGLTTTGVMSNDQVFVEDFLKTEEYTLEGMWQLPITREVKEAVKKSDVADLINSGGRMGHAIYAAAFLNEFVDNVSWIHLDIAGTSNQKAPSATGPKGPTGSMVRTIAKYIENNQG